MIGDLYSGKIEYLDNGVFSTISSNFHTGAIWHLKYLPFSNGFGASASQDNTVIVWDTLTWTSIQRYTNHTLAVWSLDQIDNDTMVSGSWDNTIRIWKISTGETLNIINCSSLVYVVRVYSFENNQIVCGTSDYSNNLRIYNYETG